MLWRAGWQGGQEAPHTGGRAGKVAKRAWSQTYPATTAGREKLQIVLQTLNPSAGKVEKP
jgi:hypothetical protein